MSGGVGSIGSSLVRKLLQYDPLSIRVLDLDETRLFELKNEISSSKIRLFIGDIRDKDRLRLAMDKVDIVFHVAALKHVPLCEYNPFEAVKTNVIGTQNMIEIALEKGVSKFITISTDKAVNPINVMGATKLLAERLTITANNYKGDRKTVFSCCRFGNVMDSRGSVIPLFITQIKKTGEVTLTDPNMTRFFLSIDKAINLVLDVTTVAEGGEIFILKMPSVKISDLLSVLINEFSTSKEIKIKNIGPRPGEKIDEALFSEQEIGHVYEGDSVYIIYNSEVHNSEAQRKILGDLTQIEESFSSSTIKPLSKPEIRDMLVQANIILN